MVRTVEDFKASHDPATIIRRLEAELREAKAQLGVEAGIREIIGTASLALTESPPPTWTVKPAKDSGTPGVPLLFLSDLHWGEVVSREQVGGVNEYSIAIARARLKHTVETAVALLRILDQNLRYPGIVLPLGGDLVSGNLHDELVATNEQGIMPVVLDLVDHLGAAIRMLAEVFGNVYVPCVSGNHGRDTKKTWAKDRNATSFDWLIYQFLAKIFATDSRVRFHIPAASDARFRVFSTRYLLTHGDQFKAGDSIIGPLGPLARGRQKKLARDASVGMDWDVMLAGHFHTYIHMATMIVNGTTKGADEWSMSMNFPIEPPQQALWVTHPTYGITYRMPVLCETPKRGPKAEWVSNP